MPYTPTVWLDRQTKLGPTNLNKIEQGIAAAISADQKAAANGIASLDANGHVPGAQRMSYGATPPTSPQDGDEWVLPFDTAGRLWRFRYNAASASAYKWEFVGGSEITANIETGESSTSTAMVDLATVGPRVILPRAGDYDVIGGATVQHTVAGTALYVVAFRDTAQGAAGRPTSVAAANVGYPSPLTTLVVTDAPAGGDVRLRYLCPSGATATYSARWIRVRPVRVS